MIEPPRHGIIVQNRAHALRPAHGGVDRIVQVHEERLIALADGVAADADDEDDKPQPAAKKQQQKKKASTVETKEIKFRPKTEEHDMDFKVKHVRRFLEGGNKVRLAVVFRGREITHPQTGKKVLDRVVELCTDIATVESVPNMEGRRMIMVIAPRPNVVRKAAEAKKVAYAAQQALLAQKKDQPGAKRPELPPDEDDLDEDEINADVDDDDDDEDGGEGEGEGTEA